MKTEAAAWHSKKVIDCQFARLVPCKPGSLTKALGKCKSEGTPSDGKQLDKIEEKVDYYRGDLEKLVSDLKELDNKDQAAAHEKHQVCRSSRCWCPMGSARHL